MKKNLFYLLFLLSLSTFAQVGVNTTSPDASSILDVVATDKGLLVPRVSLTAANAAGPITSPAHSMLVYNIVAANTGIAAPPNDISVGYYYNSGTTIAPFWQKISGKDWSLMGNSSITEPLAPTTYGTSVFNANEDFLGT